MFSQSLENIEKHKWEKYEPRKPFIENGLLVIENEKYFPGNDPLTVNYFPIEKVLREKMQSRYIVNKVVISKDNNHEAWSQLEKLYKEKELFQVLCVPLRKLEFVNGKFILGINNEHTISSYFINLHKNDTVKMFSDILNEYVLIAGYDNGFRILNIHYPDRAICSIGSNIQVLITIRKDEYKKNYGKSINEMKMSIYKIFRMRFEQKKTFFNIVDECQTDYELYEIVTSSMYFGVKPELAKEYAKIKKYKFLHDQLEKIKKDYETRDYDDLEELTDRINGL